MNKQEFKDFVHNGNEASITLEMINSLQADFTSEELIRFNSLVEEKEKNQVLVWILWALLGTFGASMLYLGLKDNQRLINFILVIVGWITIYFLVGGLILLGTWIWAIFLNINGLKEDKLNAKILAAKAICL